MDYCLTSSLGSWCRGGHGLLSPFKGQGCSYGRRRKVICVKQDVDVAALSCQRLESEKRTIDSAKLPSNWHQLVRDFMLRIAYFVFTFDVPIELIINYDHTPIHFVQQKGATWTTGDETEKGTRGKGDKRQFTAVLGTSPLSQLPAQLVLEAKTSRGMPQILDVSKKTPLHFVSTGTTRWKRVKQSGKVLKMDAGEGEKVGVNVTAGFVLRDKT
eukprot:Pompholyxophrys_punicea_v1_NODE_911_length_1146_cov_1.717690.p1 type:complete len:214 gc:universal NODE_911_length_1146_cov_1.717690:58-699(+)